MPREGIVGTGETVPDFELPGSDGTAIDQYRLSDHLDDGPVVLLFYPFDFSPVCADELCAFRDAEWLGIAEGVDLFGVSTDSAFAHRAFIGEYGLTFPLLSDSRGEISREFGVRYDEWERHEGVSKRAIVVVDGDRAVQYTWYTDDAWEKPNPDDVRGAIAGIDGVEV